MAAPGTQASSSPSELEKPGSSDKTVEIGEVKRLGAEQAKQWVFLPALKSRDLPRRYCALIARRLRQIRQQSASAEHKDDWTEERLRLVDAGLADIRDEIKIMARQPLARGAKGSIPRALAIALGFIEATGGRLNEDRFAAYVTGIETGHQLGISELGTLIPFLKLALLLLLTSSSSIKGDDDLCLEQCFPNLIAALPERSLLLRSFRFIGEIDWGKALEPLTAVHHILREDPAGVYSRMDFETRAHYRSIVAETAEHAELNERDVAKLAIQMAQESPAPNSREAHVGYFLIDEGLPDLRLRVGYRSTIRSVIQDFLRNHPDEFYLIGIESLTLAIIAAIMAPLVQWYPGPDLLLCLLFLLLPASQVAVEVMNYLATAILSPRALPKLDFEDEVPAEFTTVVAVPTLLINETQIRGLAEDLEVRYLANRYANVHYGLLTDLPDSPGRESDDDPRIQLAVRLIDELNERYQADGLGRFFLLHRHNVFNPSEGSYMGFERKRGKLLDLNLLLRGVFDSFPIKAGDVEALQHVAFVLAVDSDTLLPRGSVHRMIGAMAHPLNRPVIDRQDRVVVKGFGILQPRVGVSVRSARRSRLANIFSGQTGFDIYTRAVSDVYQDLYGEGIFTGKGIYDVDTLRAVLEKRFPRNTLLSHDLIEGAYARVGLLSDVEVIDDYPSHYSAYSRRKHRWHRGDWQIARWIRKRVPDESRRLVNNPITLIGRWRILDNLRRSLIEPGYFVLFLAGWFVLPGGPAFWTLTGLGLLFLPHLFKLAAAVFRSVFLWTRVPLAGALTAFPGEVLGSALNLVFLAHQTLVSLDAAIRTAVRLFTRSRLLQWETAYEAEVGSGKRTPVDLYLGWTPIVAVALLIAVAFRPAALPWAVPLLVLWGISKFAAQWADRVPDGSLHPLTDNDRGFLRSVAFDTWRYFEVFSNAQNHWLIPDNVREKDMRADERLSPTNLGFLLNARLAAFELGYLTHDELLTLTGATLATLERLPKHRGHLLNWYDNSTQLAIEPRFVSTVDSGNLAACLWSLQQGLLELCDRPLVGCRLIDGIRDFERERLLASRLSCRLSAGIKPGASDWFSVLVARILHRDQESQGGREIDSLDRRADAIIDFAHSYVPWQFPEFSETRESLPDELLERLRMSTPRSAPALYTSAIEHLKSVSPATAREAEQPFKFVTMLEAAQTKLAALTALAEQMAAEAGRFVDEMDFGFLFDRRRKLLTVGYDVAKARNSDSCYDLLASEARVASFIAIAKGDVPEEAWFRLGRRHVLAGADKVLVSWTGTMFEYLMPLLWMNSFRDTLLDRATSACVRVQQAFASRHKIPWGISESAYHVMGPTGDFQYAAFGIPAVALNPTKKGALVVSPYSSVLALMVDQLASLENLRTLAARGWRGKFGFYEALDFTGTAKPIAGRRRGRVVRLWMAHHQGMSLLAFCNVLCDRPFQRWFHSNLRVRAADLILQERPLSAQPATELSSAQSA